MPRSGYIYPDDFRSMERRQARAAANTQREYSNRYGSGYANSEVEFEGSDSRKGSTHSLQSEPGIIAPSATRARATAGFLQYPSGLPLETGGLRPQTATSYGATPNSPHGTGYARVPMPYPPGSRMLNEYERYKTLDEAYAAKKKHYKKQASRYSSESNTVGGEMSGYRYREEGHANAAELARGANLAGLSAATARLNFVSDHYGRQARRFHPGHLTAVEDLSVGSYKAAMVQLEHSHYGGGGSTKSWAARSRGYQV